MGKLQIDILGASFAVQAREDEAYLQKLLTYYKKITKKKKKTGIKNPVQTSIIAGITLVDELYKEKSKNASLSKSLEQTENINVQEADEAERLTLDMISAIDKALE